MERLMRQVWRWAVAGVMMLAAGEAFAVDYAEENIPSRTHIIPIQSQTVTNAQFLLGEEGTPVTIAGELRIPLPFGSTAELPAVVLLHGGGGFVPGHEVWAREILEQGFAVFMVDSFAGRGVPGGVGSQNVIVDLYAALGVLANHPRIDSSRILVMGLSLGGRATLYSSVNRFEQAWNHSGVEVAGRIALFPGCEYVHIGDTIVSDSPIRIFGGRDDASADVEKCIAYGNRLRAAGADVEVTAYDGAAHGFEDPVSPAFIPLPNNRSTRDCTIVENPAGVLINTATGQPFSNSDACVGTGTSLAFNAFAFEAVLTAVREFLAAFNPRQ